MIQEVKKYVIIPLREDELHGNVYRVGCYKFINELCNFVGVTVGSQRITEYSYAKYGVAIPHKAKEISVEVYKLIIDFLKNIYTTVDGLTGKCQEDATSLCFVMKNERSIFLVNEDTNSYWNNFELIKREVPNIIKPNDVVLAANKEILTHKRIPESLFYIILDYIQRNLVLVTRLVQSHSL